MDIFDGFEKLGKGQFVSLANYASSKSGEVANYVINGYITYQNVKENDFKKLQECTEEIIQSVATDKNIDIAIVRTALTELVNSAEKNLNADPNERSKKSQAQSNAFINFGKGLKYSEETEQFYIDGLIVTKKVVVEGTYPTVNSRPKTIAKKAIKKALELQQLKYRSFIVSKSEYVNLSGITATT